MARKPNSSRKNRSFHMESLERREVMSAAPLATLVPNSAVSENAPALVAMEAPTTTEVASLSLTDVAKNDGVFTGHWGNPLYIPFSQVVKNDHNPHGNGFELVSKPSFTSNDGKGTVTMDFANGRFIYQHPTDYETMSNRFTFDDSFNYEVTYRDSLGNIRTDVARVSLRINNVPNLSPVAVTDEFTVCWNTSTSLSNSSFSRNDLDPEKTQLKVINAAGGPDTQGAISKNAGGVTYTPPKDFLGTDRFYYVVVDEDGGRSLGVVEITVTDTIAFNDDYTVVPGETINISLLDNDKGEGLRVTDILNVPSGMSLSPIGSAEGGNFELAVSADTSVHELKFQYEITSASGTKAYAGVTVKIDSPRSTSAPFDATLSGGTLTIQANEANRTLFVRQQGNRIQVVAKEVAGGEIFRGFKAGNVKRIVFRGTNGNDSFENRTDVSAEMHGRGGHDTLVGGGGNDKLYGEDGDDTLKGRGGNDLVDGGLGSDKLYGGAANDKLVAKDGIYGNDVIDGGAGKNSVEDDPAPDPVPEATLVKGRLVIQGTNKANKVSVSLSGKAFVVNFGGREKTFVATDVKAIEFRGGKGNDTFINNTSISSTAYGNQGSDTLKGGSGNDILNGGAGNDRLEGGAGNDEINGGAGIDVILGSAGIDTLNGDAGDDRIYGGDDRDYIAGGSGDDTLDGEDGDDAIFGGAGADTMMGSEGNDSLSGEAGNDTLKGGKGHDALDGGNGKDTLLGHDGDDTLLGGDGADQLDGGDGNDTLKGEAGSDTLLGGAGDDDIFGGDGDDWLYGNAGNDLLRGGKGSDQARGGKGNDIVYGDEGQDWLLGQDGEDKLYGGAGKDQLEGGAGADILDGEAGDDVAYGNAGRDEFFAGLGNDSLYGGLGDDVFHNAKKREIKQN